MSGSLVEADQFIPHRCLTVAGGRGGSCVAVPVLRFWGQCGGQCCMVAVVTIRSSWGRGGDWSWSVVGQGIAGLAGCRTSALRRVSKISLTRAACAAGASSSMRMVCDTRSAANALIWWIVKTGLKLAVVGGLRGRGAG